MREHEPVALFFSSALWNQYKQYENVTNTDQMEISQYPFHV